MTVNNGHTRPSFRNEISDHVVQAMKVLFARMSAGETVNIHDGYFCKLLHSNGKMADFKITAISNGAEHDVLRFIICLHSRYKQRCWNTVDGVGKIPEKPFIAVRIINPQLIDPILEDFEINLAWGLLESKKMGNSNTEHSKKLRRASAEASDKKIIEEGGVIVTARLRKEHGADLFRLLSDEHGGKAGAVRFLLDFYKANKEH